MTDVPRPRWLVWRRALFALATLVLVTATHWPRLEIEAGIARPDLYLHVAAFALWAALLVQSAWFGPPLSARNVLVCSGVGLVFAAFDELTQGIPGLGRHPAFDDYLANALGIGLASVAALVGGRVVPR